MRSKLAGEGRTQSSFPDASLTCCLPGHTLGTVNPGMCRKCWILGGQAEAGGDTLFAQLCQNSVTRSKGKRRLTDKYMNDAHGRNEQTRA